MEKIKVSIVTTEGLIFEEEVKSITLPGNDGEFGVQPHHCALVSLLKAGVIEVLKDNGEKEFVAIDWGYAKVNDTSVDVLANGAVAVGGGKISESLEKAKSLLKKASVDEVLLAGLVSKIEHSRR